MKNILLILAVILIPAAAFAEEKATPTGNKPASASAKKGKVKEKCNLANIEITTTDEFGETVPSKAPIPESLSDKCYCKAIVKRYTWYTSYGARMVNVDELEYLFYNNYRAFKCMALSKSPKALETNRRNCLDKEIPPHWKREWECDPEKGLISFAPSSAPALSQPSRSSPLPSPSAANPKPP